MQKTKKRDHKTRQSKISPALSWRNGLWIPLENKHRFIHLYQRVSMHVCCMLSSEQREDQFNNHATLSCHLEKEEYRQKNNDGIERPEILLKAKGIIKGLEKSSIKHTCSEIGDSSVSFYLMLAPQGLKL